MPEDHLKRWIGAHAGLAFPLPPRLWALLALAVTDLDSDDAMGCADLDRSIVSARRSLLAHAARPLP
jgi:hypothetical protein